MLRKDKERIVAELAERLRQTDTMIIADYRGLSVSDVEALRTRLLETGARFSVVKNTLTRLAAETAGNTALLRFLDGPTAIAFIQPDGDPVAVAKVLSETARTTRVLVLKGGMLEGRTVEGADIEELAKLPSVDVLRGQVLGAVVAPLTAFVGLISAPLQDLYGLLDARVDQLGGVTGDSAGAESPGADEEAEAAPQPTADAAGEAAADEADEPTSAQPEAVRENPEEE